MNNIIWIASWFHRTGLLLLVFIMLFLAGSSYNGWEYISYVFYLMLLTVVLFAIILTLYYNIKKRGRRIIIFLWSGSLTTLIVTIMLQTIMLFSLLDFYLAFMFLSLWEITSLITLLDLAFNHPFRKINVAEETNTINQGAIKRQ